MNHEVANALLVSKAVHIKPSPEDFFTWTSGKRSPIYCDNRTLISFPDHRQMITKKFKELLKSKYPQTELIAGTATAGIPWAAWLAHEVNLPMIYIRSKPKGHGLKTAIEGQCRPNQKVVIVEDLISTGKSSLESYHHCKKDQLDVQGVLSIFTYGFPSTDKKLSDENLEKSSLCTLSSLLEFANKSELLSTDEVQTVSDWRLNF